MEESSILIITHYISAWMWHIMGMIMLAALIIISAIKFSFTFLIGLAGVVLFCELMAWFRKIRLYKEINLNASNHKDLD